MTFKSDSDDPESAMIGQKQEMLASLYRTGAGTLVLDAGGTLLTGPAAEDGAFTLGLAQGATTSYDGCDSYEMNEDVELDAAFASDLGFEGTMSQSQREVYKSCPDDQDTSRVIEYDVSAMKLDATRDIRPTGSIAWGYFSGGSAY